MAAHEARPLAGRRIVVTRAPEQAEGLVRSLTERGAQVILLPMVRFLRIEDSSGLDHAIAALEEFDWLILTSANTVRFFLGRCRELRRWSSLASLRIAVVGPATRAALEAEGLQAALAPREFSATALSTELAPQLAGMRILLPRSDRAGRELPDALRAAGAIVTEVAAYRTAEPESLDRAVLEGLRKGEVDAVAFFSPSGFQHFERALGAETVRRMSERVSFAAVGPTTAAAVRGAGAQVAVEASAATADALAGDLERYLTRDRKEKERAG